MTNFKPTSPQQKSHLIKPTMSIVGVTLDEEEARTVVVTEEEAPTLLKAEVFHSSLVKELTEALLRATINGQPVKFVGSMDIQLTSVTEDLMRTFLSMILLLKRTYSLQDQATESPVQSGIQTVVHLIMSLAPLRI